MKRWAIPALAVVCAALGASLLWARVRISSIEHDLSSTRKALADADSLAQQADDARWYAERQRDKSDGILEDLKRAYPELERRAKEIEVERNAALMNALEARQQERAKQVALEGEQVARADEQVQRRVAEARADSIAREKRISDNLRMRQRASVLAQNSLAIKGRPDFRGLMAVHALRSMEQAGGDKSKDELVRALRSSLEELERSAPVRVAGFKRPPHQMVPEMGSKQFLALGHDGLLYRLDMASMKAAVVADHSRVLEPGTGRAFLASDHGAMILTDQKGSLAAYSLTSNSLIARSSPAKGSEGIRAVASWPGLAVVVTGDANGNVQPWRKASSAFEPMEARNMGAAIKGMVHDPTTGKAVIIAAKGPVWLMRQDGAFTELPLPSGHSAYCITSAGDGVVFIGTDRGSVLKMDLQADHVAVLPGAGGPRVEVITAAPGSSRVAYVNAVNELVVLDSSPAESKIRMVLEGIPTSMALGDSDQLYLAFGNRVERIHCTGRAMANRICELIGRTWTQAEWQEVGETGTPDPTCAGF